MNRKNLMKGKRMTSRIMNPFSMLCFGLAIGAAARLLDIFTTNWGEVFSQMAVWILMGTLISIYSRTAKHAMGNVLAFCLGMLVTYYFVAALSHGVYSMGFVIGWTVFALCSPVMAYFAYFVHIAHNRPVWPAAVVLSQKCGIHRQVENQQ
ncbi:DUF6518 family protein [Oscillibacter valericigenes]|uniref:DUF6518 family protein n=1 Tax=Oscillibacter valericigenes TaxID=351091 RepID=UPI001F3F2009|nr:DUF6518 family protein [Oscillibacter valericigenes]